MKYVKDDCPNVISYTICSKLFVSELDDTFLSIFISIYRLSSGKYFKTKFTPKTGIANKFFCLKEKSKNVSCFLCKIVIQQIFV